MAMTDAERRAALDRMGLAPDGPALTVAPQPDVPAREPVDAPAPVVAAEPGGMPDDEAITALLAQHGTTGEDAYRTVFDAFKLSAKTHGRAVSSPHNTALSARIKMLQARARRQQSDAKKEAKQTSGYVRERARESQAQKAAEAAAEAVLDIVLAKLREQGIDIDLGGQA
jgi:hypothetical protein